jgi:hypothetical protein
VVVFYLWGKKMQEEFAQTAIINIATMILVRENNMSYHDLSECTLSDKERIAEALSIIKMLSDADMFSKFTEAESKFVRQQMTTTYTSVKQLFWLRDIKDKYL